MRRLFLFWMFGLSGFLLTGCARVTTSVVEKPRVDQELGGNRGYLAGSGPATSSRKNSRQMVQAEIELPTLGEVTPWRIHRRAAPSSTASAQPAPAAPSVGPEELPAPEEEWEAEEPRREETPGATPYTVKKGDTLEKIAEKFYGDAGEWRRIYNANRDVLKSPNRIYPGQKLQIPAGESRRTGRESPSSDLK